MNLRFYIDPETGVPHVHRHGVSEEEAEDVLSNPGEDRPGREGSRIAIGQTLTGRYLRVIYVPEPRSRKCFRHYCLLVERKTFNRLPKAPQEKRKMKANQFPPRWNEERVRRVLEHYEAQSEEEAVAEDEAAYADSSQTFMEIPNALVPKVRELIAKHKR